MKPYLLKPLCLVMVACTSGPVPIRYGKDNCALCKMTIMDNKFGTELITPKGKIFTFDSDECMRDYLKASANAGAQYLVTNYEKPGTLIDGKTAFFLHSPKMKSPMGGNLAAYADKVKATAAQQKLGGEVLTWDQFLVSE
ncbi:MAG: nitrous oxide reductase accessory protein NosL [Bacteroidetes bacterium]|nr:nitrous oxide reductase accessory protein NosL [Bacteroidota bacterium]